MANYPTMRLFIWVYSAALLLLVLGYFLRFQGYSNLYWLMRIVIAVTFLAFILYSTSSEIPKVFFYFFVTFVLGVLCALQFDKSPYDTLYMVFNISGIFLLFLHIYRYLNFEKMNFLLVFSFFTAILLNGYFVYKLIEEVSALTINKIHHILYVVSGSSILILLFAALFYNHIDSSKRSMNFLVFSFLFIFYHVFLVMGHYDIGYSSSVTFSISRVFLILSFVFLYRYLIFNHELQKK